ncbi:hypothetical protein HDV05_007205 [Chytridiales sp. JEL 0842]|nr:hypothetical protein HDV05_007205 [Chytridiales sp. JEL 0842]
MPSVEYDRPPQRSPETPTMLSTSLQPLLNAEMTKTSEHVPFVTSTVTHEEPVEQQPTMMTLPASVEISQPESYVHNVEHAQTELNDARPESQPEIATTSDSFESNQAEVDPSSTKEAAILDDPTPEAPFSLSLGLPVINATLPTEAEPLELHTTEAFSFTPSLGFLPTPQEPSQPAPTVESRKVSTHNPEINTANAGVPRNESAAMEGAYASLAGLDAECKAEFHEVVDEPRAILGAYLSLGEQEREFPPDSAEVETNGEQIAETVVLSDVNKAENFVQPALASPPIDTLVGSHAPSQETDLIDHQTSRTPPSPSRSRPSSAHQTHAHLAPASSTTVSRRSSKSLRDQTLAAYEHQEGAWDSQEDFGFLPPHSNAHESPADLPSHLSNAGAVLNAYENLETALQQHEEVSSDKHSASRTLNPNVAEVEPPMDAEDIAVTTRPVTPVAQLEMMETGLVEVQSPIVLPVKKLTSKDASTSSKTRLAVLSNYEHQELLISHSVLDADNADIAQLGAGFHLHQHLVEPVSMKMESVVASRSQSPLLGVYEKQEVLELQDDDVAGKCLRVNIVKDKGAVPELPSPYAESESHEPDVAVAAEPATPSTPVNEVEVLAIVNGASAPALNAVLEPDACVTEMKLTTSAIKLEERQIPLAELDCTMHEDIIANVDGLVPLGINPEEDLNQEAADVEEELEPKFSMPLPSSTSSDKNAYKVGKEADAESLLVVTTRGLSVPHVLELEKSILDEEPLSEPTDPACAPPAPSGDSEQDCGIDDQTDDESVEPIREAPSMPTSPTRAKAHQEFETAGTAPENLEDVDDSGDDDDGIVLSASEVEEAVLLSDVECVDSEEVERVVEEVGVADNESVVTEPLGESCAPDNTFSTAEFLPHTYLSFGWALQEESQRDWAVVVFSKLGSMNPVGYNFSCVTVH